MLASSLPLFPQRPMLVIVFVPSALSPDHLCLAVPFPLPRLLKQTCTVPRPTDISLEEACGQHHSGPAGSPGRSDLPVTLSTKLAFLNSTPFFSPRP